MLAFHVLSTGVNVFFPQKQAFINFLMHYSAQLNGLLAITKGNFNIATVPFYDFPLNRLNTVTIRDYGAFEEGSSFAVSDSDL
jgi:hypothetical protein